MWKRLRAWARTRTVIYGLLGGLFGLAIPGLGMAFEIYRLGWPFTFGSIVQTHVSSPIFCFVDFSPLVMGYLASVVGAREDRLARMAASLEEQVVARTEEFVRQNRLFEALFQNSPLATVTLDIEQRIIAANPAFEAMFGYSQSEMLNAYLDKLVTTEETYEEAATYTRQSSAGLPVRGTGLRTRKDGTSLEVDIYGMPVMIGDEQIGVFAIYADVTERKRAEDALKESEARYRSLFEDSPISLWEENFSEVRRYLDDLRGKGITNLHTFFERNPDELSKCGAMIKVTNVNEATLKLYEATSKDELLIGLQQVLDDDAQVVFKDELVTLIEGAKQYEAEISQRTLQGNRIMGDLRLTIAPGSEDVWDKVYVSIIDITERKKLEQMLRESLTHTESLARTDVLTGSLNRRAIMEQARGELARAERERTTVGLAIVDMDHLKEINDEHGHLVGDAALRLLAVTLEKACRLYDRVGRWGGDEFLIVLPNIEPQSARAIAERLLLRVNEATLSLDGIEIRLSVCIGVSSSTMVEGKGVELEELIRQADTALLKAKKEGRNAVRAYAAPAPEKKRTRTG